MKVAAFVASGALFLASVGFAAPQGALEITIKKAKSFDEPVDAEQAKEFKGDLVKFTKEFVDHENSEGELKYKVAGYKHHLTDAERVANYAWKVLFGEQATVEAPFPCGYKLDGYIHSSKSNSPYDGTVVRYTIEGSGDGGGDTCLGTGGPGWWAMSLVATYNPATKTGRIFYKVGSE